MTAAPSFNSDAIADKISAEILRVSAKRARLMRAAKANDAVGRSRPTLSLMDQAMDFARQARDERCPVAMIAWLRALEDFKD